MSNKIITGFLFLILGFVLGISFIIYADSKVISKLNENIELKEELISEYESYYDAAEDLINHSSIDSTKYYRTLEKLDSLYRNQL